MNTLKCDSQSRQQSSRFIITQLDSIDLSKAPSQSVSAAKANGALESCDSALPTIPIMSIDTFNCDQERLQQSSFLRNWGIALGQPHIGQYGAFYGEKAIETHESCNWTLSTIPDRDSGSGSHENVALSVSNQFLNWQWPIRVEFISLKLREERGARKGRRRWSWSWSQSSTWLAKESEANATYSYGWTIQFIHQNRMGFDWKSWNAAAATVVDSPHLRFPPLFLYLGYFIS